ncbi:MAG: KH domain-containing protein [Clostridiales bacterium]|jgi:predicted RNA-binding protein YlqC (UPF0109 family)|nr:KH domain-containing protein [Clostridiales bacterium]
MIELVTFLVNELTGNPEAAAITQEGDVITITVDKPFIGKVIGKQGKTIKAVRTIVRAAGMKHNVRYVVDVNEKGGESIAVEGDEE